MQQIDIDFEVFKALTAKRSAEDHTYNDVLREILGLDPLSPSAGEQGSSNNKGRKLAGRDLPHGTKLRATYKQQLYEAQILNGELIYKGRAFDSASAAAREITQTNVNGLTFWQVRRPSDLRWQKLVSLARAGQ